MADRPTSSSGLLDPGPAAVQRRRNELIPLPDGAELAGDLRVPEVARPVPALLTYIPYRKDDNYAAAFEFANDFFARAGYAVLVVDVRGLGSSSGVAVEALDAQERIDACSVISWMADQDWCDGNIGMWGVSYGAITALATASRRPEALKAICAVQGCADMYEDVFYPGGARNCLGIAGAWGSLMLAFQLLPPSHRDRGGRWRNIWEQRLKSAQPFMLAWHEHQDNDEYWQRKAIDLREIEAPSLLIGGWRDIFPDAMVTAFERIRGPKHLTMGPWLHTLPDLSPFAAQEWLPTVRKWWDQWLRHEDQGFGASSFSAFIQGSERWTAAEELPGADTLATWYPRGDRRLTLQPAVGEETVRYRADPTVGVCAGLWEPLALGVGLPTDQRPDEASSLTFTAEPQGRGSVILGRPMLRASVRWDEGPDLLLVAKLADVCPDGESYLITSGVVRVAGTPVSSGGYEANPEFSMWATAYELRPGHQLRLSLACADFPRFWPMPTKPVVVFSLSGEASTRLMLPLPPDDALERLTTPPAPDSTTNRTPLTRAAEPRWTVCADRVDGSRRVSTGVKAETVSPEGAELSVDHLATATTFFERPGESKVSARTVVRTTVEQETIEVRTATEVTQLGVRLKGRVIDPRGEEVFNRTWSQ